MTAEIDPLFLSFQEAVAGRYALQREIGRGGMGVVYLAREVRLDRPVAIKLLPPSLAFGGLRDRFLREARTAARLSHPNIVPIFSVDESGDFVSYVMAYVDGETLTQRVASRGPMPPHEAIKVLREIAWALDHAHGQGVVHRDVKPANILLERGTGRAMVTDFGIARITNQSGETGVGELLGTPEYMSPEQAAGEAVDARSDTYSLGIVGFYALTGSLPFTGPTAQAVLAKQLTQAPPPLGSVTHAVPKSLATVIDHCLVKDRDHRMPSGAALADALAPSHEMRSDIPVPIRSFLDPQRAYAVMITPMMLSPVMILSGRDVLILTNPGWLPITILVSSVSAALLVPLGVLIGNLRPLLRLGYGPADIAAACREIAQRKREEFLYEHGNQPSKGEKALGWLGIASLAASVLCAVAIIMGRSISLLVFSGMFVFMFAGVIASLLSSRGLRMSRTTYASSPGAAFWDSAAGRFLARLASYRLGAGVAAVDRPTEIVIAMSAAAMFEELPKEARQRLGDVPRVLKELEAQTLALRARMKVIDASLRDIPAAPAHSGVSAQRDSVAEELRGARTAAEHQLAAIVSALDTIRLDILRLRAGQGSVDSISEDLGSARALGEDVDRMLAGAAEVEASLRRQA